MSKAPFSDFTTVTREAFRFLESDHGCVVEFARDVSSAGDADVMYRNSSTFVNVHLERRDVQVVIHLGPLVNSSVPPYGHEWRDLEALLFIRGIPSPARRGQLAAASDSERRRELREYAAAVRLATEDVLQGDFRVMGLVDAIVRERANFLHHPQVKSGRLLPRP